MRGVNRGTLLTPGRRRAVVAIALISGLATIFSLLYGSKLSGIVPSPADSYGGGPLGHRLFAETLIELDHHVSQNRGSNFANAPAPMLFLEPKIVGRAGGFEHTLEAALDARLLEGRPTLVALPKWILIPSQDGLPQVAPDQVGPSMVAEAVLPGTTITMTSGSDPQQLEGVLGSFRVEVPRLQVFSSLGTYDTVLLDGPEGAVVVRTAEGLVVVSDPDLFHNFNHHRAQHAELTLALLRTALGSQEDTVVLDEVFHGHGAEFNIGEAMGEFPAVLLVAHLILLLLILFAMGTHRFGPALPLKQLGHGPSEAIAVSASVLADGQRAGTLVLQYICELIVHTHEKLGLPTQRTIDESAAALDEAAARRGVTASARTLYQRAVNLQHAKRSNNELWAIARQMHFIRQALLGREASAPAKRSSSTTPASAPPNEPEKAA